MVIMASMMRRQCIVNGQGTGLVKGLHPQGNYGQQVSQGSF